MLQSCGPRNAIPGAAPPSLRVGIILAEHFTLSAFAVFVDATVVRGVCLPAALALLGDRAWYLPRWLRWLPAGLHV